jgi:hypothetical protein
LESLATIANEYITPFAGGSAAPLIVEALAKGEPAWADSFEYA